mgnify:CR=1 FL=1
MRPMQIIAAACAALVSVLLAVTFARALPAMAEKERQGRKNAVSAVCENALKPDPSGGNLGPLPADPPGFTLKDWNDNNVSLAQTRGRVTLVNFWATWCSTCVVEMPSLEKLAAGMRDRPFTLLAVTVDEKWDEVARFFAGKKTNMTVLLDAAKAVPTRYGTEKFPETFIIDKEGKARFYVVSDRDWAAPDVKACLDALVDE